MNTTTVVLAATCLVLVAIPWTMYAADPFGPGGNGAGAAPRSDQPPSNAPKSAVAYYKINIEIPKNVVELGQTVDVNFSIANLGKEKTDVIKPVLDIDSVSLELTYTPDQGKGFSFTYTVVTPSAYEHDKAKLEKITLDKFGLPDGTFKTTFSIPAIKQGRWSVKAVYKGSGQPSSSDEVSFAVLPPVPPAGAARAAVRSQNNEVVAVIDTNKGKITCRFLTEDAPNHAINFIKLAKNGFYNNLIFHRVIKGFMIQGGCPQKNGMGGPGYNVRAEFNQKKHLKGTLSMARSQHNDSGGSQFYICLDPQPRLDNQYTVFGEVVEGMEVVDAIGNTATTGSDSNPKDKPIEDMVIKSVTIETRPVASQEPKKK
jgi:peptidyl-prolyl cis-trans isomerase B (cyclophilin B)